MATYPDYLDFDLELTHETAAGRYVARVLSSPKGEAEADVALPFDDDRLENVILKLGRTRTGVRRLGSPQQNLARSFGAQLYDAVFAGEVGTCFRRSLDEADRQDKGLRVRLRLGEAPELADVPWEYLFSEGIGRFLVLSAHTPVVRYLDLPREVPPLTITPPLRILLVVSAPSDLAVLDTAREMANLNTAWASLIERGLVSQDVLAPPTLSALRKALRTSPYHVLHFIGHGGYDEGSANGVLAFEDDTGHSHLVNGGDLGTMLHDHRTLRLAVLNACEGARTSPQDPFSGVAQSLVLQGLPAVVAMQFEITDEAAIVLAQEFYSALSDGYPVDAALAEGRKAVFGNDNDVEWGTPVLYLRAKDGRIFDVTTGAPTVPALPEAAPPPVVPEVSALAATTVEPSVEREAGAGAEDSPTEGSPADDSAGQDSAAETSTADQPPQPPHRVDEPDVPEPDRRRLVLVAAGALVALVVGIGAWLVLGPNGADTNGATGPGLSPTDSAAAPTTPGPDFTPDPTVDHVIAQGVATIDGDPQEWSGAEVFTADLFVQGTHPPTLSGDWQLMWDSTALYFRVVVNDDQVTQVHQDDLNRLWLGDGVNLDLGPDAGDLSPTASPGRASDGQYTYGPQGNGDPEPLTAARTGPKLKLQGPIEGAHGVVTYTDGGYEIEASLPWAATGVASVGPGRVVSMVLNVADAWATGGHEGGIEQFVSTQAGRSSAVPGTWPRFQLVPAAG